MTYAHLNFRFRVSGVGSAVIGVGADLFLLSIRGFPEVLQALAFELRDLRFIKQLLVRP